MAIKEENHIPCSLKEEKNKTRRMCHAKKKEQLI